MSVDWLWDLPGGLMVGSEGVALESTPGPWPLPLWHHSPALLAGGSHELSSMALLCPSTVTFLPLW